MHRTSAECAVHLGRLRPAKTHRAAARADREDDPEPGIRSAQKLLAKQPAIGRPHQPWSRPAVRSVWLKTKLVPRSSPVAPTHVHTVLLPCRSLRGVNVPAPNVDPGKMGKVAVMLLKQLRDYLAQPRAESGAELDHAERRAARRRTVYLHATVYPIDVFCDVRICDASATGVKGEANVELSVGQIMHITTDEHSYHPGTVKWVFGRQFGLDLPNALQMFDVETESFDHGISEGHRPRLLRQQIDVTARLLAGRPPRPATIRNVSSTGMLLDTGPGLRPGQHIIVKAGSAPCVYGRTQWAGNGKIGFKAQSTISTLAFACLDE